MMYIVTYPSSSEFGRGSPDMTMCKTKENLDKFLLEYRGDLSRVRVFEATELGLKIVMEKIDATKD